MKTSLLKTCLAVAASAWLGACAGSPPSARVGDDALVPVEGDRYEATFNAARQVLRDRGFVLERVDAREGVITTQPKTTAGIVTPWDREQQTAAQEVEDLFERQQRVVRITFEPPADGEAIGAAAEPTVAGRIGAGDRTMHVQVTIQRVHIPGRKLEPEAISQTSYYWDPALGERLMQPSYAVAYKGDRRSAERLADLIAEAAARPAAVAEPVEDREEPPAPAAAVEPPAPVLEPEPTPSEPAPVQPALTPDTPAAPSPVSPWIEGKPLRRNP